jgi:hypothetical protein
MKPFFLILALGLSACTQSARITLRNQSAGALAYATIKQPAISDGRESVPSRRLPSGQSVEVPLVTVVSKGLDLPFVLLGTNVVTSETLLLKQDQATKAKQFDFPFPQQQLTDHWVRQDYLGRLLTRNLGRVVIVDPPEDSYWKALGRTPVKLKTGPDKP